MAENGTTIAKAYVQIMPSAQGIKANLTKAMGGDVAAAGTSAGQSFGSKMASAIKGVLATAAIGKALTATIAEGADLEQSLGGVKTLFGDAADIVIANAQNAYKTTQLSANDYMENITGFSAHLLQSMGGDTEAAAALADTAMRDMADNANKMGTDMGYIQETYQSLARGNYEMLDNLKLGYGGTQAEMARLINDSGVLGDTMEATANNVNSIGFDKFIEAIHVIQERMGLAGTATEEAETTITGSLNAMKASFANVLGNLTLGQDIGPSLNALAQTVTTFLTANLLPAVWNILSALPGALVTFVSTLGPQLAAGLATFVPQVVADITAAAPQMLTAAQALVTGFATAVTTQLPTLLQNGVQLVQQLVNGAVQALPGIMTVAGQIVNQIGTSIISASGQILTAGTQILTILIEGISASAPMMMTTVSSVFSNFITTLSTVLPQVAQAGMSLMHELGSGFAQGIPEFLAQALPLLLQFTETLRANFGQFVSAGLEMITGLAQGLIAALPTLIAYVPKIVSNIAGLINDNAPKLLATGLNLLGMLAQGILQAIPALIANLPQIVQAIADVFTAFNWLALGGNIIQLLQTGITGMVGAVQSAATSIFNAIKNAIMNLPATLASIASSAGSAFTGALNGLVAAAASIAQSILSGIVNAITALPGKLLSIAQNAISSFRSAFTSIDWASIGTNIINGIVGGITSAVGGLVDAAKSAAASALDAAKNFLGINSPSKVMRDQVGRFIPEGMALGITRNLQPLRSAMSAAVDVLTAQAATPALAMDSARWQPGYAAPGGAPNTGTQQTFIFNQPVQTPDEFARAVRIQQTYGLAGGR